MGRRGRPKASILPDLIREGQLGNSEIKCDVCGREFPRMKSLTAHKRTHTDEKPYLCTYPTCQRTFTQSGHLKIHVKRHTGEKPFVCVAEGCTQRYLHPSRKCPKHNGRLKRDKKEEICMPNNPTDEEIMWFALYKKNKGKPVKRKISISSPPRKSATPSSSQSSLDTSGSDILTATPSTSSSLTSSDSSCSEISTDCNYSNKENALQSFGGQLNCSSSNSQGNCPLNQENARQPINRQLNFSSFNSPGNSSWKHETVLQPSNGQISFLVFNPLNGNHLNKENELQPTFDRFRYLSLHSRENSYLHQERVLQPNSEQFNNLPLNSRHEDLSDMEAAEILCSMSRKA